MTKTFSIEDGQKVFRVTERDLYEFNAWIKGKSITPRLRERFKDDQEYEDYMIQYQDDHVTIQNDPSIVGNSNKTHVAKKDEKFYSDSNLTLDQLKEKYPEMIYTLKELGKYPGKYFASCSIKTQGGDTVYLGSFKGPVSLEEALDLFNKQSSENYDKYYSNSSKYVVYREGGSIGESRSSRIGSKRVEVIKSGLTLEDAKELRNLRNSQLSPGEKSYYRIKYGYTTEDKVKSFSEGMCPESGCIQRKDNGSWGIISNKTGEPWDADYESEADAKNALKAYHSNKTFSEFKDKSFGNPLTNLPRALDNKLMDFAQITLGAISYTDIFKYADNFQSSKSNDKLNRLLNNWHEKLDEGDEEKANDVSDKIIKIIKGIDSQKAFSKTFSGTENLSFNVQSIPFDWDNPIFTLEDLIGSVMYSVTYGHLFHYGTDKYDKHIALDEYYKEMPELVDALAEHAVGDKTGMVFTNRIIPGDCPIQYLTELVKYCKEAGPELFGSDESGYQSQLDDITNQIESTLYKLKRLDSGHKVFSMSTKSFGYNDDYYVQEFKSRIETLTEEKRGLTAKRKEASKEEKAKLDERIGRINNELEGVRRDLANRKAWIKDDVERRRKNRSRNYSFGDDHGTVIVKTSNPQQLAKLIEMIKDHGNPDHSFECKIDTNGDNPEDWSWDGDGADSISDIQVEDIKRNSSTKKFSMINSADDFRKYAHTVMKNAHGDEYSEEVTDKVVDDLLNENPDADYGELIGRLTSGFGE